MFFQKKIETEGHSPRGMHGYLDSLKEKIRSFDREKVEQELYGIFGLIRQEPYVSINVLRRNFYGYFWEFIPWLHSHWTAHWKK